MNGVRRQFHIRILVSALLILLSLSMLVMVTFAWYVMSTAPEVAGMQIKIGSDTIRVAPDLTDENGAHYPGAFSGTLAATESGDLWRDFWGLLPVSTADGKHWYAATYEPLANGGERNEDEYTEDITLKLANQTTRPTSGGNYLYLDFWVVAPKDYDLRVSTSSKSGEQVGSFAKVLPTVTVDKSGSYTLDMSQRQAEASLRVGFLVNEEQASLAGYQASESYDTAYKMLKGVYQKQGEELPTSDTKFTIYEPNCDWHADEALHGKYSETSPLALRGGKIQPVKLTDIVGTSLAAQTSAMWTDELTKTLDTVVLAAKSRNKADIQSIQSDFEKSITAQSSNYVTGGQFIKGSNSLVNDTPVDSMEAAGAADDAVIVSLKKNVPQRIRMFVWLEGQDVDCTNEAAVKTLLLNLELAGQSKQ